MSSKTIYHTCNDRTPYTYLIGWSYLNKYYYGRRTAKNCHPNEFWKTYFTSSRHVRELRMFCEPDIIEIRYIFATIDQCKACENRVLSYEKAAIADKWLNLSNGDLNFDTTGYIFPKQINMKKGRPGIKKSEEHKEKIKLSNIGKLKPRSKEYSEKRAAWISSLTEAERKEKFSTEYTQEKKDNLSLKVSKGVYEFTSPTGDKFIHHSINAFAKIHNLSSDILYKSINEGIIQDGKFGSPSEKRRRTNGWSIIRLN